MMRDTAAVLYDLLSTRRSVRQFLTESIPDDDIDFVLKAGCLAPSGANFQPWLVGVITDPELKKRIRLASEEADSRWNSKMQDWFKAWLKSQSIEPESKPFLEHAPVLLVVFGNTLAPYWLESVWICISYMLLAAHAKGLGSVPYTPGYPGFLNDLLSVPETYSPQAILPLGKPDGIPDRAQRPRRPVEDSVFYNSYTRP